MKNLKKYAIVAVATALIVAVAIAAKKFLNIKVPGVPNIED